MPRSLLTILLTVSLLIATPLHCQYFITADDSHCLAIGTKTLTNTSQLFWCNISSSSHCINWAFEKHFNHETQSIYNGKLYVDGIGVNAMSQETYLNQRMYVDDTDFIFIKAQSQLPSAQTSQAVGYDSTNNIIELVGGSPNGSLHVQYSIDSDTFTALGQPFDESQFTVGHAYTQIDDLLYTGNGFKFDVLTKSYTALGGDALWRSGCLATISSTSIFFVSYDESNITQWYNVLSDTFSSAPSTQETHAFGTCQIVNGYLYVIGGQNSRSVEKLYVDISNVNAYSFEYLSQSLTVSGNARSEVIANNIFIQTWNTPSIQVLDTVTDTISIIGDLTSYANSPGSILVNSVWYLFGVSLASPGSDLFFYDFSVDTDANINDNIKANGIDEFEFDLIQNTLMNKKYGSNSIRCTLGMSANDNIFVLHDNTTIDGYAARFDCSRSGSVTSHSISLTYQRELFYVFQNKMLDFDDSDASCRFNYGENLASIHDDDQNEEAIAKMGLYGAACWFGLNDIETEGAWTNRDGTVWDYGVTLDSLPWRKAPDGGSASNCVVLINEHGQWDDQNCPFDKYSLCNHPHHTVIINEDYYRSLSNSTLIGIVDILDEIYLECDIEIHSWPPNNLFYNILHIGDTVRYERFPALYTHTSGSISINFVNAVDTEFGAGYLIRPLTLDTQYHLTLYQTQEHVTISVDGAKVFDEATPSHPVVHNKPIYVSNPWHHSADATVSNLFISTSNAHTPNEFNYLCDADNRLSITGGGWIFATDDCTVQSTDSTESWNVVWLGGDASSMNWTDYTLEATFTIQSGRAVHLLFRTQSAVSEDDRDGYFLVLSQRDSKTRFGAWSGTSSNYIFDSTAWPWEFNVRYTVRVEIIGTQFTFYRNDDFLFTSTDSIATYLSGTIGLRTFDTIATFQSVRIVFQSANTQSCAYLKVNSTFPIEHAEQACLDVYGTSLASIHSARDYDLVRSICDDSCWLGGISTANCVWQWNDGTEWNYEPQINCNYPDKPYTCIFNNASGLHDCDGSNQFYYPICNAICDEQPSSAPTTAPTRSPTSAPSSGPSAPPTKAPSTAPSVSPTFSPSSTPSLPPSVSPTSPPSLAPSLSPTSAPSLAPSVSPTKCYENGNQVSDDGWEPSVHHMIESLEFNNQITDFDSIMRIDNAFEFYGESLMFDNQLEEEVVCEAQAACHGGSLSFSNMSVCNVLCNAPYSCGSRSIHIKDCQNSEIICNGTHACDSMKVEVHSSSNGMLNVYCGFETSCNDLEMNVFGNAITSTACIGLNACGGVTINVDPNDYKNNKLQMFSYSSNVTLSNGFGYEELNGSAQYVECYETSTYIEWNESMTTNAQVTPLILNEYEGGRLPCDSVTIECFQTNNSQSVSSCNMKSSVKAEAFTIESPDDSARCYWVEVNDIIDISCTGNCVTSPTEAPTSSPTESPTDPTRAPTMDPTTEPTIIPTSYPTVDPTMDPTRDPTIDPTTNPTVYPTIDPTIDPTIQPTIDPTINPTIDPTNAPTISPSTAPSNAPTTPPSNAPSQHPSVSPSIAPTIAPSTSPTTPPTVTPSFSPSNVPSLAPSHAPSNAPSYSPSNAPTRIPTVDVDDANDGYKYYINITYAIANLTESNKKLMVSNTYQVVQDLEEILESNYFDEEALQYKDFWVNIHRIDGVNVESESSKLTEYNLDINNYEDRANLIDARIETSLQRTGFIITRSDTKTFTEDTRNDLSLYLNNSDVYFKVATDVVKLKAYDKSAVPEAPTNYDIIIFATFVLACGTMISLVLLYVNRMKDTKTDNAQSIAPFLFSFQIYDFVSDIFLCNEIGNHMSGDITDIITVCFIGAVVFTVYPFLSNVYYGVTITKQDIISRNKRENMTIKPYFPIPCLYLAQSVAKIHCLQFVCVAAVSFTIALKSP
eukprot:123426_1